jgi:hypothetical protein
MIHDLIGMIVAGASIHQLVHAEVLRLPRIRRRDDIPSRPPAADVIQRGKHASDVKWMIERRGKCAGQADVLGFSRHRRQQQHWVEEPHLPRPRDLARKAALVGVEQGQHVNEEQRVEPALFQHLRDLFVARRVERLIGITLRMSPATVVVPRRTCDQVANQMHLTRRHRSIPAGRCIAG